MRYTEKRNGKNVIPLRNAVCGFDMPKWSIAKESDIQSFLSGDAVDRLAELEDALESGKIVRLPCKVGDTVYFVCGNVSEYKICEVEYDGIFFIFRCFNQKYVDEHKWFSFFDERIGKTVFLTREEAEKKLEEVQE